MVAALVILAFGFVSLIVAPAQAAMVDTADLLKHQNGDAARQKVLSFMERQDVAQQFQAMGVNPDEAKARVAAMTDEEINVLANRVDQMPAGGVDGLGILLALAVIAFVTLIVLDIVGVTDVFTFIKKS
jgi:hypothetical protein